MNALLHYTISPIDELLTSVIIIPITPNEKRNLIINYSLYISRFGQTIIGTTEKGVCFLAFGEKDQMLYDLKKQYPFAIIQNGSDSIQFSALNALDNLNEYNQPIYLHIKGTEFQLKVWNTLLKIPQGKLTSYHLIAEYINNSKADRAVGNAVGNNPVSYFIPCHRVIRTDGSLGGYRWGLDIKEQILNLELNK
ncbi:MAG: methylated-DNA--[protein]-cysteine S-methyltransferase [Dysgonamonadaceae bacterium]|nr:methylated-DNA--[protein]-cysteine S-methyltransferase [Dysgonamonadaceae bacterium]MDD3309134.1 methylated-DNA--[protein]-cysteine S-methyltransferase [Dysgonamonadaceae bacterium]MDD3900653.1 methylated-DNA--[protein]-cysteine S-methyltransferase [Dysgonamonadaceae bacterium]MDD4397947.1 methylated-DNA--[protein]-cysteine S-methyltransferase [Dysgonamonadaceae bacterium]